VAKLGGGLYYARACACSPAMSKLASISSLTGRRDAAAARSDQPSSPWCAVRLRYPLAYLLLLFLAGLLLSAVIVLLPALMLFLGKAIGF
jgi:hypothetical protein